MFNSAQVTFIVAEHGIQMNAVIYTDAHGGEAQIDESCRDFSIEQGEEFTTLLLALARLDFKQAERLICRLRRAVQ